MTTSLKSHWGIDLNSRFVNKNSDTLCVILPGIAYYLDRSYLDYSKQLSCELGFDTLEVEYGFQTAKAAFSVPDEFDIIVKETIQVVESKLEKEYKKIVIIGKSIGTCVQIALNKHLEGKDITNIYISPIDKTVGLGITENAFVITSSSDPLLSNENFESLKTIAGITLTNVEGANHALDLENNVLGTIDALKTYIQDARTFLTK
ncbi:alpha/beta hydrolase [Niameybacter massiliensis]|uniref:alpha/beta hydrolase n=1 Tax=Niameybacter massiliensis TaxID=1658108 RepID=UPI0006B688AD|nr:alpha/beta hydrolase [Niameybacter massiliensis]